MLVVKSKSLVMDMNDSNPSVSLFSDSRAVLSQVGGKGFSLMRMAQGGFPVPPGMAAPSATEGFFLLLPRNTKNHLRGGRAP